MMASVRPFRFAVIATRAASAEEWAAKARRAEELGYDVLLITDHVSSQLAAVPALAAAAAVTTRLRLGSFVFANDYRNPVMLAKEAATLDLLSGGRLELGIGAGWATRDYEQMGIRYDAPAVRVGRMIEAVRLVKRLLEDDVVEHAGVHYRTRAARVLPRPVQRPRPPIMVAGGGPRVLSFAAREAEIVGFAPQVDAAGRPHLANLTTGATEAKVGRVRAAAGDRFASLELNAIIFDAQVTGDRRSALGELAGRMKAAVTDLVDSPYFLFGTLEQIRGDLLRWRERLGISYFALPDPAMESLAPVVADLRGR